MEESTLRELAFLRDLYIEPEWTQRFTDLFDQHVKLEDIGQDVLYMNAGTGGHVLALREKLDKKINVLAICEDEQMLKIARSKASLLKAKIEFATRIDKQQKFDAVFADASLVKPEELRNFIEELAENVKPGGQVSFYTPTSGSFGEIFSFLWEVLFNEDLGEHGAEAERLVTAFPTVSQVEEMTKDAGFTSIKSYTSNEIFEYSDANEMINSVLISRFFVPVWLGFLDEEKRAGVCHMMTQIINEDYGDMSFRFSVKATLINAKKI